MLTRANRVLRSFWEACPIKLPTSLSAPASAITPHTYNPGNVPAELKEGGGFPLTEAYFKELDA